MIRNRITRPRIVFVTSGAAMGFFLSVRPRTRWYRVWAVMVPFNIGVERG